ncbi:MAG: hypothetical protein V8T31_10940 [Lachnospiraceae bacterium]
MSRLRMSLDAAEPGLEKLVFLHYPPVYTGIRAPGDRGHAQGMRHPQLLLQPCLPRQRYPLCGLQGEVERHPLQVGECRRAAILPISADQLNGKTDKN